LLAGLVPKRAGKVAADDDQAGGQNPFGQAGSGPGLAVRGRPAADAPGPPLGLPAHAGRPLVQPPVHDGQPFLFGLRLSRTKTNTEHRVQLLPPRNYRRG